MSSTLKPLLKEAAPETSRPLLDAVESKFGFTPNLMKVLAHNPAALKSYLSLSEAFGQCGLTDLEQQVVALSVSIENKCDYCVSAHSAISAMSKLDPEVIQAVRTQSPIKGEKLEALRIFTQKMVSTRGWIKPSDEADFLAKGYTTSHILSVILGISMKTLSNYVNHITQTEIDEPFKKFQL